MLTSGARACAQVAQLLQAVMTSRFMSGHQNLWRAAFSVLDWPACPNSVWSSLAMADVRANMAAVTVPPVTKSTALSDYLFGKQGRRVLVPQPHRQHLMILPTEQEGGG